MDAMDLAEARFIAIALVQRLRERSIPPDDAFWWARIIHEALLEEIDVPSPVEKADAA